MRYRTRAGLGGMVRGVSLVLLTSAACAAPSPDAPGVGDPYFPGAGGYDVAHYNIRLTYQPATDLLSGTTTILATTTQELSRFNLDFGLKVQSVRVNDAPAKFANDARDRSELVVTPAKALATGESITVLVNYADTPSKVVIGGFTAWKKTPDGALAEDEPQSARWWYPSNDHPTDKATFDVSVDYALRPRRGVGGRPRSRTTSPPSPTARWSASPRTAWGGRAGTGAAPSPRPVI
jgi:aminopeptidase N